MGFSHRDLKLNNLLFVDGGEMKICDFGLAGPCDAIYPSDNDKTLLLNSVYS